MLKRVLLFAFILMVSGCNQATATPDVESPTAVSAIPTIAPAPSATVAAPTPDPPTAVAPTAVSPAPSTSDLSLTANGVTVYPYPTLYAGDKATFQIVPNVPPSITPEDVVVRLFVDGRLLSAETLSRHTFSYRAESVMEWIWDTGGQVGEHQIRIVADGEDILHEGDENPDNNVAEFTIVVADPQELPPAEANAGWRLTATDCCVLHTVTGTAADRDRTRLKTITDAAMALASKQTGEQPERPLDVYFIDRVIGQGGYAGSAVVVSYLDRKYVAGGLHEILTHEMIHMLDQQFAPQRPSILAEGFAVWGTNGHYKQEDLNYRTAALRRIGRYIPLETLANEFYTVAQHEIGYLEAAGFTTYLIDTYGWQTFYDFYRAVSPDDGATTADALDENLQRHYHKSLTGMEAEWIAYLDRLAMENEEAVETAVADLQTTIDLYNTMRRYQELYDPTANFLTAWMPSPDDAVQFGNPADLTRHPEEEMNVVLEVMLQAAGRDLENGRYDRASVLIGSINRALNSGQFMDPLANNYLNIVRRMQGQGYETLQVEIDGDQAFVEAAKEGKTAVSSFKLRLFGQTWTLLN